MIINKEIDTKGTRCPLPLLRAKQALRKMEVGECLKVLATDPGAEEDFEAMLKHLPHELIDTQTEDDVFIFIIKKGG